MVIPAGNLLVPSQMSVPTRQRPGIAVSPLCLSFPQGICCCRCSCSSYTPTAGIAVSAFCLSFPQGICWCRCTCSSYTPTAGLAASCFLVCHSRRKSAGAVALVRPTRQRPGIAVSPLCLSFPQGICWCRCSCSSYTPTAGLPICCFFVCHSRRESAGAATVVRPTRQQLIRSSPFRPPGERGPFQTSPARPDLQHLHLRRRSLEPHRQSLP